MMQKKPVVVSMLVVLLAFGLLFMGCPTDAPDPITPAGDGGGGGGDLSPVLFESGEWALNVGLVATRAESEGNWTIGFWDPIDVSEYESIALEFAITEKGAWSWAGGQLQAPKENIYDDDEEVVQDVQWGNADNPADIGSAANEFSVNDTVFTVTLKFVEVKTLEIIVVGGGSDVWSLGDLELLKVTLQ